MSDRAGILSPHGAQQLVWVLLQGGLWLWPGPGSAGVLRFEPWCALQFNRVILGKFLTAFGYEVVFGCDGMEAVNIFEEERGKHGTGGGLFCVLMVSDPKHSWHTPLAAYGIAWDAKVPGPTGMARQAVDTVRGPDGLFYPDRTSKCHAWTAWRPPSGFALWSQPPALAARQMKALCWAWQWDASAHAWKLVTRHPAVTRHLAVLAHGAASPLSQSQPALRPSSLQAPHSLG